MQAFQELLSKKVVLTIHIWNNLDIALTKKPPLKGTNDQNIKSQEMDKGAQTSENISSEVNSL